MAERETGSGETLGQAAPTQAEKQAYIDHVARSRGYVREAHKIFAQHDLDAMKALEPLTEVIYHRERNVDRKTKELCFIAIGVVMRLSEEFIRDHIRLAVGCGASHEEILEIMEITIAPAGYPAFQAGLVAWARETGAKKVEPSKSEEE